MADKKIVDFITLADAKDDDLILVASEGETYTMKVRTLKEAVLGSAQRAEAAAMEVRGLAVQMKADADSATVAANLAAENANTARESANTAASAANIAAQNATEQANEGERKITVAVKMAEDAANTASIAAQEASESKTAADTAAENANTKAQEADTATQNANSAAQAATTAKENAQTQGAYAQEQGDRAAELIGEIERTDVGGMVADILALQNGKADLVDGKVPGSQLPEMNYDAAGAAEAVQKQLSVHVGSKSNPHSVTFEQIGAVPITRTVNGFPLNSNITLTPEDIGVTARRAYRFVIGISTAGWTENDCDYLCDGVDDQVEIQEALNNTSTGEAVLFLPGTYYISDQITIPQGVSITGGSYIGWGNSVLNGVIIRSQTGSNNNVVVNVQNMGAISHISFFVSIQLWGAATLENLTCISIYGEARWAKITNCEGYIRFSSCENTAIIGLNGDIQISKGLNVRVIACNCYSNGSFGFSDVHNSLMVGCFRTFASSTGIYLMDSTDNLIVGNQFFFVGQPGAAYGSAGIYLRDSSRNLILGNAAYAEGGTSANYGTYDFSIRLYGDGNNDNFIANNLILGKNYVSEGGTGNTFVNNKYN